MSLIYNKNIFNCIKLKNTFNNTFFTCSESPLAPPTSGPSSYFCECVAVATERNEHCAPTTTETPSRWADRNTNSRLKTKSVKSECTPV